MTIKIPLIFTEMGKNNSKIHTEAQKTPKEPKQSSLEHQQYLIHAT